MNKKVKIKYDGTYIRYVSSGEAAAVFITRDIVPSIDTTNKWIDIPYFKCHGNNKQGWDFEYFICELFPRKKYPCYPKNASDEDKKYITWNTAHEDISEQRRHGYKGPQYKICPKLVKRSKRNSNGAMWDYIILSVERM